jgi:hypothetical protein
MSTSAERADPRPALPPDVLLTTEEFRALPQPLAGGLELHDGRVVEVAPVNLIRVRLGGILRGASLGQSRSAAGQPHVPGNSPTVSYVGCIPS